MSEEVREVVEGEGWAAGHIDAMGDRYGFRKVRRALGVTAFGVNVLVIPEGVESGRHYHDQQEELYFVHRGVIEMDFGDGSTVRLGEGGVARVDPATVRSLRNVGSGDAVYLAVGGRGGYVGRDGRLPSGEQTEGPPGATG